MFFFILYFANSLYFRHFALSFLSKGSLDDLLSRGYDLSKMVRSAMDEEAEISTDMEGIKVPSANAITTGANSFVDSSVDTGIQDFIKQTRHNYKELHSIEKIQQSNLHPLQVVFYETYLSAFGAL